MTNFAIMLVLFVALWAVSVKLKNASIVDIMWGVACALPATLTWLRADGSEPRAFLLTVLVAAWGLRLASYLAIRNIGHGEDYRYAAMRRKAPSNAAFARSSLFKVFLLQCLISFFVSLPTQVGQFGSSGVFKIGSGGLGLLAIIGVAIYAVGLIFEAVGDYQLRAFKKDPANKGKLMDRGLWAWTRHPNYFGDAAVWTGLTLIALESAFGVWTILSPILMVYFLYAASGKALLERSMSKRYPDYAHYKARVSGFFPRPPRKSA
ncbi:DUF1295 domain-containing protein [Hyphococcus luteus]|uniref:Uncharacterized protein n=1 Tax=Hyphococcus luteus TaxID=2058213 RepID=A0A2S7K0F3_9PROT|nr:DUF1295 domain-containing protein [Marinicaulis flavus]PQA85989.1 hypothetical protein CW354_16535 [Marinicaulis flavus]